MHVWGSIHVRTLLVSVSDAIFQPSSYNQSNVWFAIIIEIRVTVFFAARNIYKYMNSLYKIVHKRKPCKIIPNIQEQTSVVKVPPFFSCGGEFIHGSKLPRFSKRLRFCLLFSNRRELAHGSKLPRFW